MLFGYYTCGFSCSCNLARLLVTWGAIGVTASFLLECRELKVLRSGSCTEEWGVCLLIFLSTTGVSKFSGIWGFDLTAKGPPAWLAVRHSVVRLHHQWRQATTVLPHFHQGSVYLVLIFCLGRRVFSKFQGIWLYDFFNQLIFLSFLVCYFIIQIWQPLHNDEMSLPELPKLSTPPWLPNRKEQKNFIINLQFPLLSFLIIICFVFLLNCLFI